MKTLIAGPWVGEFGWELFAWHGYIRALSRKYDKTIIISRENSKALYDDFATEFIAYNPSGGDPDAFFMHNVDVKKCFKEVLIKNKIPLNEDTTLLLSRRIGVPPHTHYEQGVIFGKYLIKPEYICFGEEGQKQYDFVFHIRNRSLRKEDNWNLENWFKLKELLGDKKIACIGTKNNSGHVEGTEDLRDLDLKKVFDVLRNARCTFGSSSGPIHLASLCGCPHIVWGDRSLSQYRYEENWNPLRTRASFLSEFGWHPTAEYVYEKFAEQNHKG